jgi:carboxymethylenebutenolidase
MKKLNADQKYFVEEFYEDYREGLLSRRTFIRRMVYITGSMAAAAATMSALGCSPAELPAANEPVPPAEPAQAELGPVPDAKSPFSVPEGDPAVIAETVMFASGSDQISGYLAQPAAEGTYPAILVCHENRGLNPHILDVTRRFAKAGYVSLAIDLLSREGGTAQFEPDAVSGALGEAGPERHTADFIAGFHYLESLPTVAEGRIGMTGYCFGGGVTWQVATALPELKAAVPFYGRAPELANVPNIKAAVLGVYAELDERINADNDALDQALTEAGVTHQMNVYPGVNHAFHNDTGGRYDETQATQAWQDTLAWFETHL